VHLESHQYIDVVDMFKPVTKWSTRVTVANTVPEVVRKAFRIARLEKPGATHIDCRRTCVGEGRRQAARDPPDLVSEGPGRGDREGCGAHQRREGAAHPAGNGVARRHAAGNPTVDALRRFVERSRIPATWTYMAKGSSTTRVSTRSARSVFSVPAPSSRTCRAEDADVVIAIGYDLVEWAPVLWKSESDKTVIHVDSLVRSSIATTSRRSRSSASWTSLSVGLTAAVKRVQSDQAHTASGRSGLTTPALAAAVRGERA